MPGCVGENGAGKVIRSCALTVPEARYTVTRLTFSSPVIVVTICVFPWTLAFRDTPVPYVGFPYPSKLINGSIVTVCGHMLAQSENPT